MKLNIKSRISKDPLYKQEVIEFIQKYISTNGKPPNQKHFSIFVEEVLCQKYKKPYAKIYHYISKFFNSNKSLYPKKYLSKTKDFINIM